MGFDDGRTVSGICFAEAVRSVRATDHMQRATFAGDDLRRLPARGFD